MLDPVFKALDDATRRSILDLLRAGDQTAGAIADHFKVTRPTISHHLDLLKQADLILAERRGQFIVYSLNTSVVDDCIGWLLKLKQKAVEPSPKPTAAPAAAPLRCVRLRRA
jgi:ArsR family transcriptional regulator, arsenate/arsenite/antimonite-responsive transcriptional repressor